MGYGFRGSFCEYEDLLVTESSSNLIGVAIGVFFTVAFLGSVLAGFYYVRIGRFQTAARYIRSSAVRSTPLGKVLSFRNPTADLISQDQLQQQADDENEKEMHLEERRY